MIVYLDTSVILRHILNQPPILRGFGEWDSAYTSELMGVEARRTFDRLRLSGAFDDEGVALAHTELLYVEQRLSVVALTREVLKRASLPLPTSVKTLDALHLTTAILRREGSGETLTFCTHDTGLALAARALDFDVKGVDT